MVTVYVAKERNTPCFIKKEPVSNSAYFDNYKFKL